MLRLRAHDADELSHYSAGTSDVEFLFPWGWGELEGIAQRTDYDLTQHAKHSGEKLDYFDQATGTRYVPYVVEPAAGATRTMAAFLLAAYDEDEVGGEARTVLRLHPRLAPVQGGRAARCRRRSTLAPLAKDVHRRLAERWMVRLRRHPVHRPALPPPGRGRHAATASRSTSTPWRTARSPSASATPPSRSGCRSRLWSASCPTVSGCSAGERGPGRHGLGRSSAFTRSPVAISATGLRENGGGDAEAGARAGL